MIQIKRKEKEIFVLLVLFLFGASLITWCSVTIDSDRILFIRRNKKSKHLHSRGTTTTTTTTDQRTENNVIFWWETQNGSTVNHALARIMHAAVKSAVIAGIPEQSLQKSRSARSQSNYAKVIVFSNSLHSNFFCGNGAPQHTFQHTKEQEHTQQFTCRYVTVQTYSLNDLLKDHSFKISNPITKFDTANKLLPNDLSDLLRFLLIYRYGGTYIDLDQIMLRPLPPTSPLLVQERSWSKKGCRIKNNKRNNYCDIIGSSAISASCIDPMQSSDNVLSLYSGVMGNFPQQSEFAAQLVQEVAHSLSQDTLECNLGW